MTIRMARGGAAAAVGIAWRKGRRQGARRAAAPPPIPDQAQRLDGAIAAADPERDVLGFQIGDGPAVRRNRHEIDGLRFGALDGDGAARSSVGDPQEQPGQRTEEQSPHGKALHAAQHTTACGDESRRALGTPPGTARVGAYPSSRHCTSARTTTRIGRLPDERLRSARVGFPTRSTVPTVLTVRRYPKSLIVSKDDARNRLQISLEHSAQVLHCRLRPAAVHAGAEETCQCRRALVSG